METISGGGGGGARGVGSGGGSCCVARAMFVLASIKLGLPMFGDVPLRMTVMPLSGRLVRQPLVKPARSTANPTHTRLKRSETFMVISDRRLFCAPTQLELISCIRRGILILFAGSVKQREPQREPQKMHPRIVAPNFR